MTVVSRTFSAPFHAAKNAAQDITCDIPGDGAGRCFHGRFANGLAAGRATTGLFLLQLTLGLFFLLGKTLCLSSGGFFLGAQDFVC